MDILKDVYDRLTADAELASLLDLRDDGEPAVYFDPPPQEEMGAKARVIVAFPTRQGEIDTFTENVRDIDLNARIYAKVGRGGSTLAADLAAERVRRLFHPASFLGAHAQPISSTATGPVDAPTSDANIIGRLVSLRLVTKE